MKFTSLSEGAISRIIGRAKSQCDAMGIPRLKMSITFSRGDDRVEIAISWTRQTWLPPVGPVTTTSKHTGNGR
jgi:hypothetical protein